MKREELRKLIKEEMTLISESSAYGTNSYDLKNIGGGFGGTVYTETRPRGKKVISVSTGLFSGGNKKEHEYAIGPKVNDMYKAYLRDDNSDESYKLRDTMKLIEDEISKGISAELKKFDSVVLSIIDKAVKKHNK